MNQLNPSNPFNNFKQWQKFQPKVRVLVVYGGFTERAVSLESGTEIINSLNKTAGKYPEKYPIEVIGFDYTKNNPIKNILNFSPDLVFIALHGGDGENGNIQGFLQSLNIPYTGSGVLASALSMDKLASKQLWLNSNLPCPKYVTIAHKKIDLIKKISEKSASKILNKILDKLNFPFVIKPIDSGSSLGVSLVKNQDEFIRALKLAQKESNANQPVMIEQYIKGPEITVSFLANKPIGITAIEIDEPFYNYQAKYISNTTRLVYPAPLSAKLSKKIIKLANKAYKIIKMSGWGRIDLILDQNNQPFLLEANTVPGMTSHSLVPFCAKFIDIDFDELVIKILQTSYRVR